MGFVAYESLNLRVYNILVSAGIIEEKKEIKKEPKHLKRPDEPLKSFQMDFTQKRIGTGEKNTFFVSSICIMIFLYHYISAT
jgi:hypothetical protein